MASINIVFRPSVKAGKHAGSLSLRVIVNRKPMTVAVGCHLYPEEWDSRGQAVIYPVDNQERALHLQGIEENLAALTGKMRGIIRALEQQGRYTAPDVVFQYRLSPDNGKLLGYATALSAALKKKGQKRLADAYLTVSRRLVKFNKGMDIPLAHINGTLIKDFEACLKEEGKLPNTISYHMRNLRSIYNKAVKAGRVASGGENPFADVFTGVQETRKRALSAEEVNKLQSVDFEKILKEHEPGSRKHRHLQSVYQAQRLFNFCLYAQGMCFVDLCHLKKKNVRENVIRYYRKKTSKQIEVPVNEGMREMIDSFVKETAGSEYLFPLFKEGDANLRGRYETALRAQNRRLKTLAGLAGLDKAVATHVARHSWASILKNNMQPLSVISEGLGHASEKTTRKYLDSFDLSILDQAGKTLLSAITRPS